ncbi:MAG: hypothetical protein IIA77_08785 [Proteobacteria bacterium]|nr:hypothetical protein [Pseudomonadota bacterium]
MKPVQKIFFISLLTICISGAPSYAFAEDETEALKVRIESLEKQLSEIKDLLKQQMQNTATKAEVNAVKKEIEVARSEQSEWKTYDSTVHLGGYGTVGYTSGDQENDRFNKAAYSPIFHYTFKDLILLQAELEIEVEEGGETEVALEYMMIDWFLNDYVAVMGGKFLSPLGYFRQNLHPSWINKLPTAPAGFGHDQAAPIADVGLQFRGGVPLGDTMFANYSFFVSNGPNELELNEDKDEIEAVETAGTTGNEDDNFLFGGRIGFVPMANVEIGISGAFGDVGLDEDGFADRDYDVFGIDGFGRWKGLDLRGEWIRQKVGSLATSVAPDSQEWEAWYLQGSYKFSQMPYKYLRNLEAVVRYSDYDSNHADQRQEQWTLGLNYLIAPQAMVKMGYEFNDGLDGEPTDEDRLLIQLSYGF